MKKSMRNSRRPVPKNQGIRAVIEKRGETYLGFQTNGHAYFAPVGQDIVCAAVSMISIQTVNAIEALTTSKAAVEIKDGYLTCRLQTDSPEAQLLLKAYELGLNMILQEYGAQYIQIEYREV